MDIRFTEKETGPRVSTTDYNSIKRSYVQSTDCAYNAVPLLMLWYRSRRHNCSCTDLQGLINYIYLEKVKHLRIEFESRPGCSLDAR